MEMQVGKIKHDANPTWKENTLNTLHLRTLNKKIIISDVKTTRLGTTHCEYILWDIL